MPYTILFPLVFIAIILLIWLISDRKTLFQSNTDRIIILLITKIEGSFSILSDFVENTEDISGPELSTIVTFSSMFWSQLLYLYGINAYTAKRIHSLLKVKDLDGFSQYLEQFNALVETAQKKTRNSPLNNRILENDLIFKGEQEGF